MPDIHQDVQQRTICDENTTCNNARAPCTNAITYNMACEDAYDVHCRIVACTTCPDMLQHTTYAEQYESENAQACLIPKRTTTQLLFNISSHLSNMDNVFHKNKRLSESCAQNAEVKAPLKHRTSLNNIEKRLSVSRALDPSTGSLTKTNTINSYEVANAK